MIFLILDINAKLNTYWNNKKEKYSELLDKKDVLYPFTAKNVSELACKEFVWWCAEEGKNIPEKDDKDTFLENLFSQNSQAAIKVFFVNQINALNSPAQTASENLLSDKQLKYIKFLIFSCKDYSIPGKIESFTKSEASLIIDFLKAAYEGKEPKENTASNKYIKRRC